jgi:glucokinase
MKIVVADIGGTNARFAIAELDGDRVITLSHQIVLKTAEYADLASAWRAFAAQLGEPPPRAAGVAIAGPVVGETLTLTNTNWVIRPAELKQALELDRLALVNDFAAVAHAVAHLGEDQLRTICGPERALPGEGVISVVGPGTGLGAALLVRNGGRYGVIATESGHAGFAPGDDVDDAILARLRARLGRVSVERVVSGPGLVAIYNALAERQGAPPFAGDDRALWSAALAGEAGLAAAALERFCLCLGAAAGDVALAHGARGVAIAGGLGLRLADVLPRSRFVEGFVAKGRFEQHMAAMPVKLVLHEQPGLLGAAAAFARERDR